MAINFSKLNNLIAANDLDSALKELYGFLSNTSDPQLNSLLSQQIILSAEYNELMTQNRAGQFRYSDYQLARNIITQRMLSIVQELAKNEQKSHDNISTEPFTNKPTIVQNHSGSGHNIAGDVKIKK